MKLLYVGTWLHRDVYIHKNCKISHSDYVQSLGRDKDTLLVGCSAYVDSFKRKCLFCGDEFKGEFPKEETVVSSNKITNWSLECPTSN